MFIRGDKTGARREVHERTPTMNERGKSDRPVVPEKSPNKTGQLEAEGMEGRVVSRKRVSVVLYER